MSDFFYMILKKHMWYLIMVWICRVDPIEWWVFTELSSLLDRGSSNVLQSSKNFRCKLLLHFFLNLVSLMHIIFHARHSIQNWGFWAYLKLLTSIFVKNKIGVHNFKYAKNPLFGLFLHVTFVGKQIPFFFVGKSLAGKTPLVKRKIPQND